MTDYHSPRGYSMSLSGTLLKADEGEMVWKLMYWKTMSTV